jgi:hypothetical protein
VSRKKKFKQQVIDQMLNKQISVPEARARLASLKTGAYQAPGGELVQKSAAGGTPAPVSPASLWTGLDHGLFYQYEHDSRPERRESARQALVDRGMLPGEPSRGDTQVPITLSPEVRGHLHLPGGFTI